MDLNKYCETSITADKVDIFHFNSRLIINGYSFSGKSRLCINILKKCIQKIDKIILANNPNFHEFQEEKELLSKIDVLEYTPSISELKSNYSGHKVVILDDNYVQNFNSETVLSYFVQGRHNNISVILICQNLFVPRAKYARDISLNATHFILLRLRDLNQIQILASQIFGKKNSVKVLEIYKYIHKMYKWGHLLIDVSQNSIPEIELRSNIAGRVENNDFEICFKIIN